MTFVGGGGPGGGVEKEYSEWKKSEKLISGRRETSIRQSRVGTKFFLKITLEFLDQIKIKRVFPN